MMYAVPVPVALIAALFVPFCFVTVTTFVFELVHLRFAAFAYEPALVFSEIV